MAGISGSATIPRPFQGPHISVEVISIIILCAIFLIATVSHIHLGALSLSAAFILGMFVLQGTFREKVSEIASGFPGDLFVVLAGVTYLFAIARNNGTVDWLVHASVRMVRGRISLLPWVMFFVTVMITAVGAAAPAAVAMIAPVGMSFAARYGVSPLLVGLMVVNGASAGNFSPIGIFGSITNGVVERSNLPGNPLILFVTSFLFNVLLCAVAYVIFGRSLKGHSTTGVGEAGAVQTTSSSEQALELNTHRTLTLLCLVALATGALFFGLDVGFSAFVVAVVLSAVDPKAAASAINQIAWPTVLLVCGIVTYVNLMRGLGAIDFLGKEVASVGTALVASLIICYIGGAVSAFASTTGILSALIPLAVPFLQSSDVSAVGLIAALAISSSVVDSSPFSTSGSLVVANAAEPERDEVNRKLMRWGFSMVALAPLVTWLVLVLPGWL